jgi:hypothetical protein
MAVRASIGQAQSDRISGNPIRAAFVASLCTASRSDLVPQAEERQYQRLPAITIAIGFMIIFALSTYL